MLPKWYRQDREEEMVGMFLAERTDDLDQEHGWPGWGETFAMLGLAVRTRGEVVSTLGVLGLVLWVSGCRCGGAVGGQRRRTGQTSVGSGFPTALIARRTGTK